MSDEGSPVDTVLIDDSPPGKTIRVGTSGFSYDDWVGPVYPERMSEERRLGYYSNELKFDVVEIGSTYYQLPEPERIEQMVSAVPEDFRFVVKAHRSMTRDVRDSDGAFIRDEGAVERFLSGLEPMTAGGFLQCVLVQFPVKFKKTDGAVEHLKWLSDRLRHMRMVAEFWNTSWLCPSIFDLLKRLDVAYCVVDKPCSPSLTPSFPVTAAPIAYFRFQGANVRAGLSPNIRQGGLYGDDQLRLFLDPIVKAAGGADDTLIFFGNHHKGQAVTNAKQMKKLLAL